MASDVLSSPTKYSSASLTISGKLARWSMAHPFIVLFLAAACGAPFITIVALHFDYDGSFLSSAPDGSPVYTQYIAMTDMFGQQGVDSALYVPLHSPQLPLISEGFWPLYMFIVQQALIAFPEVPLLYVDSPVSFNGRFIDWNESQRLIFAGSNPSNVSYSEWSEGSQYIGLLQLITGTGPGSWNGNSWTPFNQQNGVIAIRPPPSTWAHLQGQYMDQLHNLVVDRVIPNITKYFPPDTWLAAGYMGPNDGEWSNMKSVMAQFPVEVAITVGALFFAILVLFRSLALALKTTVTMLYSVSCTFGIAIMCFHYNWLHSVWPPLQHIPCLFWLIIIISFSITCVLAIDYDVFMTVRIIQFHKLQIPTHRAVVFAVSRNGPVISYAALIMVISFGSLIAANTVMINQFGLILSISVMIDAFIVRPVVVPALLSLLPEAVIWWPRFGCRQQRNP